MNGEGGLARRSGLEEEEDLELEVGVELQLELELELEPGLPAGASVEVVEVVHNSFIKPFHHLSVHKSVHKSFMTAVWLFRTPNDESNTKANNNRHTTYHHCEGGLLTLVEQLPQHGGIHGWAKSKKSWVAEGAWMHYAWVVVLRIEADVHSAVWGVL